MWFIICFAAGVIIGALAATYEPRDKIREEFDRKYAHLWKMMEK